MKLTLNSFLILATVFNLALGNLALAQVPESNSRTARTHSETAELKRPGETEHSWGTFKQGEKPLITPKDVQSDLTAEQAVPRVFVTAPYDSSFSQLVETGADGGLVDSQLAHAFRTGTNGYEQFKGQKKFDIDFHYEFGDPRSTVETIAEVKDASFSHVVHITDFNTALDVGSNEPTTYELNRLIKEGKFKNNSEGRELKKLLEATQGEWEVFGSDNLYSQRKGKTKAKLQLFSQEVFGKDPGMKPIVHNKERVLGVIDEKTGNEVGVIGYIAEINLTLPANVTFDPKTGKASPLYRINSGYFVAEPNLLQNMIDNAHATMDAFGDGLGIKGIKPVQPVRVLLKGGGSLTLYYTAGVMNPNSTWVDILNDATATWKTEHGIALGPDDVPAKHKTEIKKFRSQQFDISYRPQLEAEKKYIALNTPAEYSIVSDAQFSVPGGFGFPPVYAGFPLDRDMGGQLRDFAHVFGKNPNFSVSVFFGTIPGMPRTHASEDPTDVVLLHSKSQDSEIVVDGQDLYHGEVGSFNRSGHIGLSDGRVGNSESRLVLDIPIASPLAQALLERTPKTIDVQKQQGRVFTGVEFVTMAYIANITGKLLEHVSIDDVHQIMELVQKAERLKTPAEMKKAYGEILDRLQAIFEQPAKLDKPLSPEKFAERMKTMRAIFDWYSNRAVPQTEKGNGLWIQGFWSLLENVRHPNENPLEIKQDFNAALFRTWAKDDKLSKDIADLWKAAGIEKPLPPDRPKNGEDPAVGTDVKKAETDQQMDKTVKTDTKDKTKKTETTEKEKAPSREVRTARTTERTPKKQGTVIAGPAPYCALDLTKM